MCRMNYEKQSSDLNQELKVFDFRVQFSEDETRTEMEKKTLYSSSHVMLIACSSSNIIWISYTCILLYTEYHLRGLGRTLPFLSPSTFFVCVPTE